MRDERILELIHGEIDGENTPSESAKLNAYLLHHPEARELFDQFNELSATLGHLAPVDPPPNLRKNILNAIPRIISATPARRTARAPLFSVFFSPKVRYAYAFAAGLAIGIVFLLIWAGPSGRNAPVDTSHLYGTIMPDASAELYRSAGVLDVQAGVVSGSLGLSYSDAGALAHLNLRSGELVDVVVSYDPQSLQFSGIRQYGRSSDGLRVSEGTVQVSLTGENDYLIAFKRSPAPIPPIRLKVVKAGTVIFEKSVGFETAAR